jgi:hypothetical protein
MRRVSLSEVTGGAKVRSGLVESNSCFSVEESEQLFGRPRSSGKAVMKRRRCYFCVHSQFPALYLKVASLHSWLVERLCHLFWIPRPKHSFRSVEPNRITETAA